MSNTTRLADMERPTQLGSKILNGEVIPLLSAPVQGNWTSYYRQKIIYLKSKLTGKASSVLKKKKKVWSHPKAGQSLPAFNPVCGTALYHNGWA